MTVFHRFKNKWNIQSNSDFLKIFMTFSLAGTTNALLLRPCFHTLARNFPDIKPWLNPGTYIVIFIAFYQGFLLVYGFLFGQLKFFLDYERKFGQRLAKLFWFIGRIITGRKASDKSESPSTTRKPISEKASA